MCNLSLTPHSNLEKDNSLKHSCVSPKMALADPEGGLRGLQPPLNFQKKEWSSVWPLPVVIYLVVTSSNNVCLCPLNGVVIGYYTLGTPIFHFFFLPGGAA